MRPDLNYKAFISYDQDDVEWARWLQKEIESFTVPSALVGTESLKGPVPGTLRPVFRDRPDLPASSSYHEQIQTVIQHSDHLIVVCSTNSAKSRYVDDEIRRFKMAGKQDRILALIVNGEPNDPKRECFPPSLKLEVAPDGTLTDQRAEPLAADARPNRDGRRLAFMKLVAGLLGVELDDLIHREQQAQRQRARTWASIAAMMALLAVIATGSSVYAFNQRSAANDRLSLAIDAASDIVTRAVQFSETHGVPRRQVLEMLNNADEIFQQLGREGLAVPEFQLARGRMLRAFATSFEWFGKTDLWLERASAAVQILEELTNNYPDNESYAAELALAYSAQTSAYAQSGNLGSAKKTAEKHRLLSVNWLGRQLGSPTWREQQCEARQAQAFIQRLEGNSNEALALLKACETDREQLISTASQNNLTLKETFKIKRSQARVLNRIGDIIFVEKRDPETALGYYQKALDILVDLRGQDNQSPDTLELLASTEASIGLVYHRKNDLDTALQHYEIAAAIAKGLSESDRDDVTWQALSMRAQVRMAHLLSTMGKKEEARDIFVKSLTFAENQSKADPTSIPRLLDLGSVEFGLGMVTHQLNDFTTCVQQMARTVATFEKAMALSPENSRFEKAVVRAQGYLETCKAKLAEGQQTQPAVTR